MANQEEVILRGKFKWVKHIRPDTAFEPNKWTVTIYPDEESLVKIKELKKEGMQNHLKMDDDGQYMQFGRKTEQVRKGRKEGLQPPRVIDSKGVPVETAIGNGSDGIIVLEVYRHKTSVPNQTKKAARWSKMRVDNLVEYKPEDALDGGADTKSLREEPEQLF